MEYHLAMKEKELVTHVTTEMNLTDTQTEKKPGMKEYLHSDSIYVKFQTRQNESMVVELGMVI